MSFTCVTRGSAPLPDAGQKRGKGANGPHWPPGRKAGHARWRGHARDSERGLLNPCAPERREAAGFSPAPVGVSAVRRLPTVASAAAEWRPVAGLGKMPGAGQRRETSWAPTADTVGWGEAPGAAGAELAEGLAVVLGRLRGHGRGGTDSLGFPQTLERAAMSR